MDLYNLSNLLSEKNDSNNQPLMMKSQFSNSKTQENIPSLLSNLIEESKKIFEKPSEGMSQSFEFIFCKELYQYVSRIFPPKTKPTQFFCCCYSSKTVNFFFFLKTFELYI